MSLNSRQRKAIPALLTGDVTAAAAAADVTRRTVHRWLAEDPAFARELQDAQDQAIAAAIARLSGGVGRALQALEELFEDPDQPGGVRQQAARTWLAFSLKYRDHGDLAQRVARLEALFDDEELEQAN